MKLEFVKDAFNIIPENEEENEIVKKIADESENVEFDHIVFHQIEDSTD